MAFNIDVDLTRQANDQKDTLERPFVAFLTVDTEHGIVLDRREEVVPWLRGEPL